jgi:hypothetical protein
LINGLLAAYLLETGTLFIGMGIVALLVDGNIILC